mmetsp:Transcript_58212/g.142325  ORF Transcript_58212/g.142325 Transcript_58212/m.142325 type:complete len:235 (-) Transcript_58212:257-961(-)
MDLGESVVDDDGDPSTFASVKSMSTVRPVSGSINGCTSDVTIPEANIWTVVRINVRVATFCLLIVLKSDTLLTEVEGRTGWRKITDRFGSGPYLTRPKHRSMPLRATTAWSISPSFFPASLSFEEEDEERVDGYDTKRPCNVSRTLHSFSTLAALRLQLIFTATSSFLSSIAAVFLLSFWCCNWYENTAPPPPDPRSIGFLSVIVLGEDEDDEDAFLKRIVHGSCNWTLPFSNS